MPCHFPLFSFWQIAWQNVNSSNAKNWLVCCLKISIWLSISGKSGERYFLLKNEWFQNSCYLSPLLSFFVQTVYHQKDILEAKKEAKAAQLRAEIEKLQNEERRLLELKEAGLLTPEQREGIKNVRCKMYWAYRIPKGDTKQIKVWCMLYDWPLFLSSLFCMISFMSCNCCHGWELSELDYIYHFQTT